VILRRERRWQFGAKRRRRSMPWRRCPICRQLVADAETEFVPFCSQRCQQIDLGRWLDERYSVPLEKPRDDEEIDGEHVNGEGS
jgi:endogenous inhibitor of DNA gyrase (YacG/DUF329 family)